MSKDQLGIHVSLEIMPNAAKNGPVVLTVVVHLFESLVSRTRNKKKDKNEGKGV